MKQPKMAEPEEAAPAEAEPEEAESEEEGKFVRLVPSNGTNLEMYL